MRTIQCLVISVLATLALAVSTHAQNGKRTPKIDPLERRFTMEFNKALWPDVFQWLGDQSGMPYSSIYPAPKSTFTFATPQGRKVSLNEAIDFINDALAEDQYTLIRREVTLTMIPFGDGPDQFPRPTIAPEELASRPRSEVVQTAVTLKHQNADRLAPLAKAALGAFGHVTSLPDSNQLIVRGKVDQVQLALQAIRLQDEKSLKYDFAPGKAAAGFTQVSPTDYYSPQRGYGFDLDSKVSATERGYTSDKPFFFSVALPEGSYDVRLTLGDTKTESDTRVLSESRRLMLESVKTPAGKMKTRSITVNIRNSKLKSGGQVKLKDRETKGPFSSPVLHWDDKLTLEFAGNRPCVCMIEIVKNEQAATVYLAGDSTVTDQTTGAYRGWGQMLPRFFKPGSVAISNHAESGEATTSFIGAKRFEKILDTLKKGDYLFIQFGHNDQNQKRPIATYKDTLKRYVAEARKRDATPVLLTPMQRRNFGPDGKVRNSLGDYPDAVREVARAENVMLIDLHAMSKEFYETLGAEQSKAAFVDKDNTHTNEYGGHEFARFIAETIQKSELPLAKQVIDELPARK